MSNILRYLRRYPFSITILLAIIALSFTELSATSITWHEGMDKLAHFCMYAGVSAVLWAEFFLNHRHIQPLPLRYGIAGAVVAPIIFSGIIEIGQAFLTDNRTGDTLDFICNCLGVSVGTLFAWTILRRIIKR